jgi:hypothetical protein
MATTTICVILFDHYDRLSHERISSSSSVRRLPTIRQIRVELTETLEFHASLGYKAKSQGKGKPYLEGRTGDDLHRKTGKWMLLERVIDRARNWYKELITDSETGKVVHHCEEPLTDHRDRGSAKKKSEP